MTRTLRTYALFSALSVLAATGCKKETATTTPPPAPAAGSGGHTMGTGATTKPSSDEMKAANDTLNGLGAGKVPTEADMKKMEADMKNMAAGMMTATATIAPSKAAATQPANKAVTGTVTFTGGDSGVKVVVDLAGLSPGKHGIHLHEKADLSDDNLKSAGGHWNPDKAHHGAPGDAPHHAGDLGNIEAGADGKAHLEVTLPVTYTVGTGGKLDVVGHSVIIHASEDDLKTDPSGNSGDRIAGGAIEGMK